MSPEIDARYLIKVSDYQPIPLPKPKKKYIWGVPVVFVDSGEDDLEFKWGGLNWSSE